MNRDQITISSPCLYFCLGTMEVRSGEAYNPPKTLPIQLAANLYSTVSLSRRSSDLLILLC